MATELSSGRRSERALLTRARQGDIEALRALVHRFSSVVWAASTLALPDDSSAVTSFCECWEGILTALDRSHLDPDLAGMVTGHVRQCLLQRAREEPVAKALASAVQLTTEGASVVHVPQQALAPVTASLIGHADRLAEETRVRRGQRRRTVLVPAGILCAIVVGLVIARAGTASAPVADSVARGVRLRVIEGDLVPLFRDCVSPPFAVTERDVQETRPLERISLVLEEIANTPPRVTGAQIRHLQQRVVAQDLVESALEQAERTSGDDREVMLQVHLILEEIANL